LAHFLETQDQQLSCIETEAAETEVHLQEAVNQVDDAHLDARKARNVSDFLLKPLLVDKCRSLGAT
jgi:hypothetical protein